jgi:hypothetical protein
LYSKLFLSTLTEQKKLLRLPCVILRTVSVYTNTESGRSVGRNKEIQFRL